MDETTRLTYYYKQLQTIEEALIMEKSKGNMVQILIIEAQKMSLQDAIKWLESLWFKPNT